MAGVFLDNIYLTLLLPFWLFLIIMFGRFFSVYVNKFVIYILTLLSSAFGLFLTAGALYKLPVDKILETGFQFIKINDFVIYCGLHVDRISLIFALVLFVISFFVQMFSFSYMRNEKKTYRFYALLNLFNFSMAGLFFSPNLFQMYFMWEIVGIVSYLLIGFEYFKDSKSSASKKVLLTNRIGDTSLITAIIMCSYFIYAYAPNKALTTLSFIDMHTISTLVYAYTSTPLFWLICILFLIGAIVKSAQFPFYTWLQDAMEAKLPVSALLHSATLVASGVFLILRLLPFYTLEVGILKLVVILGVLTAFICSISACSQVHPKKVLAYSTSAQLGLIFCAIGVLNIKAALALFVAHAFIKSVLFITLPREDEKWNYFKFIIFLVSGLSLSGLLFSGMVAKEFFATGLGIRETVALSLLSFLTAFYVLRIALLLYSKQDTEKTKLNILELFSILGLVVFNIIFYIYLHKNVQYKIAEPFWSAMFAWVCVYILYIKNAFWKVPFLYQLSLNGFYLDKFYTGFCSKIYTCITKFCNYIDVNILANFKLIRFIANLFIQVFNFIEIKIMNGTVKLITNLFRKISLMDLKIQDGNIQKYNAYALIIITLVVTLLVFGYVTIITFMGGIE